MVDDGNRKSTSRAVRVFNRRRAALVSRPAEIVIEAAARLMVKYPHSVVAVKDLQSGELTAIDYKSGLRLF
jgi:hypothetical protein